MAEFRRCIPALAVLVLLMGLVSTASAQQALTCTANAAVPPLVRGEGLTDLLGDIVLNCTGGVPTPAGSNIPQANISVFLNTAVTSRLLGGSSNASEALLLIDEPGTTQNPLQLACTNTSGCVVPGNGGTGEPFSGVDSTRPNIFEGLVSGNSVTFLGVPIDPPGTGVSRIYRITNVRGNASAIAPGGSGTPGQVVALVSASSTFSLPISNPSLVVGFVQNGLSTSVRKADNSGGIGSSDIIRQQCVDINRKTSFAVLRYSELFATAFKTRGGNSSSVDTSPAVTAKNVPGAVNQNIETGFYNPALSGPGGALTTAGLADFGTRLKAVFNNIPNGVSVFVTTANINQSSALLARLVGTETGAFFPVPATNSDTGFGAVANLPVVNGSATAVWEVLAADPLASQTYDFGVTFGATASAATNSPAAGIGTVNMSFAPTPPAFTASSGATAQGPSFPIPRFVDTSTARNILNIVVCRTNLLFPFVTNQAGFDTGLAISNTSTDPFGTAAQTGACTLNWYGANAPAAITTPSVASGTVFTTLASTSAPNFQGYMIAVCNFQYAHGFAFVSDLGARNLAMGYLALIIPDPPRSASPFPAAGGGSGEQLGY